jgi:tetratricopeptide (TPR) repeat protein
VNETELDPKLLNLWKKSLLANETKNWDYVVSLALPVVKAAPMFFEARLLLRRAEGELVRSQKKSLFGGGMSMSFKSSKKDPFEAIAEIEENVFQKDPFNIRANQEFYDHAMRAGEPALAALGLETIRAGHPANTKVMHQLAEHYMGHGEPEKAGDVYRAILKNDPRDMAANKGEKDAAARTSIERQGWQGTVHESRKDAAGDNLLELLNKQGMTREQMEDLLGQLSTQYDAEPENIGIVKNLANVLEKMENYEEAMGFYSYALTLNPSDVSMQRRVEMLQDKIRDIQIAQFESDIEAEPNHPDVAQKRAELAEIRRARGKQAVEEAKIRVDRNPTDKAIRFDLGQAYFNCDMYTEAIPELQQARQNPHIRTKALLLLGRCFERKNMNDLAVNAFVDASKELTVMDNTKKEVLYELAMVYEKMGKRDEYLEALKEIYNNDYGYRDVAKRVESSYA